MQHVGELNGIVICGEEQIGTLIQKPFVLQHPRDGSTRVQSQIIEYYCAQVTHRPVDFQDLIEKFPGFQNMCLGFRQED